MSETLHNIITEVLKNTPKKKIFLDGYFTNAVLEKTPLDLEAICEDICNRIEITPIIPDRYYKSSNGCFINKIDDKYFISKNKKQLHKINNELKWVRYIDTLSKPSIPSSMKAFDSLEDIMELFETEPSLFLVE